jgi:DivIVA domain-containing protein
VVLLLEVLAVLAVVFGVAVVLTGRAEGLSEEGRDLADTGIPRDRPMTPHDVVGLRFALAFRGYRMSEVDDALDRLAAELAARDEAINALRARAEAAPPAPAPVEVRDVVAEPEPEPEPEPWSEPEPPAPEPAPVPPPLPEPVPVPAPVPEPAPEPAADPLTAPIEQVAPNPFRPEVPDIPVYDPWSVTPRSRYTDGPTYVEVEHPDDDAVDDVTAHQTGYAPAPEPAPEDPEDPEGAA